MKTIAARSSLRRTGLWLGRVVDEWLPPVDVPDNAATWQPDEPSVYCPRCGASAGEGSVTPRGCAFCLNQSVCWQRITRLAFYGPPVDEWVRLLKFQRRWCYGPWLGKRLAEAIDEPDDADNLLVCSVPMHRLRRWRRGFNQADLLARAVADARGWTFAPILKRTRHTPPQTAIAPSRRADNVRHSFAIERVDLTGYEVVLVDDVKTSGATLAACTRLLMQAGAISVHAAVVAVADPKAQAFHAI